MTDWTIDSFLPEYIETVYGLDFKGALVLWNKSTKSTRLFDSASTPALIDAVKGGAQKDDVYIGLATQPIELPPGKRGGSNTVQQVSAFFGDIDFAGDKPEGRNYPTDAETARQILDGFVHKPTFVQNSGGGLHVIWALEAPLACGTAEARERAAALSKAFQAKLIEHFKEHGFDIDHCGDVARLYRVPLSQNHKYDPPRTVEVVSWNPDQRLDTQSLEAGLTEISASDSVQVGRKFRPADHALIQEQCGWYADQTGPGAALAKEPDWVAALSITVQCADGPAIAHGFSKTHPSYSEQETDRKLKHVSHKLNPFTCETIRTEHGGAPHCEKCPFYGTIKSPVQLGHEKALVTIQRQSLWSQHDWPEVTKSGKPIKSLLNAKMACELLGVTFEYDRFHNRLRVGGHDLQVFQGDLSDKAAAKLHSLILERFGFDPGKGYLFEAIHMICIENQFHPVLAYLDKLQWDGVERLETWLIDHLGAEDKPLNRAIGKMLLVAAVRRVREPGVKYDTAVVLEGRQGSGKSTAVQILAGAENFSDQSLFSMNEKEIMEAIEGVWFFEIAELEGISRAENAKVKAILTRTVDRGRPAFARFKESWPRQCVFIATTNEDFYLKDLTGNRRFLPVMTGQIDLEALRAERDQLFAEACALEAEGYPIVLPEEFWSVAAEAQASRLQEDPWLDVLERLEVEVVSGEERVHTEYLFSEQVLNIPVAQRKSYHTKQVGTAMRSLGWDGPKKLRVGGKVARGYSRPTDKPDSDSAQF